MSGPPQTLWLQHFALSAVAACTAESVTVPLDTCKVRLQLQGRSATPKYRGILGTIRTVAREEGVAALWKGVVPGLHRQVVFGGLRLSLYDPVKHYYQASLGEGLGTNILSALTTGALAIAVACPTELVKIRMQAEGRLPPGIPRKYPTALGAYGTIYRQEGLRALWTGLGPNVARNSIINAAELASYDEIKHELLRTGVFREDNAYVHLLAGAGAGFFAVCVGLPADVIKSRMMGAPPGKYQGVLDVVAQTLRHDGPLAFYKGFSMSLVRLGSWNMVLRVMLEQLLPSKKPQ